jgi:hypothetical protein
MIPPMAKEISRTKPSVLCEAVRMEEMRRTAGKSVRMAEYAAPLATANWSCSSVLQSAIRTCFKNRNIKGAVPEILSSTLAVVIVIDWLRLRNGEGTISKHISTTARAASPA